MQVKRHYIWVWERIRYLGLPNFFLPSPINHRSPTTEVTPLRLNNLHSITHLKSYLLVTKYMHVKKKKKGVNYFSHI